MNTEEIETTTQSSLDQYKELDGELPDFRIGMFVKRTLFLNNPQSLTIKKVVVNNFGKPALVVEGNEEKYNGELSISNQNFNDLKQRFGKSASDWKDKVVTAVGTPYSEVGSNGEKIEGVQLTFK